VSSCHELFDLNLSSSFETSSSCSSTCRCREKTDRPRVWKDSISRHPEFDSSRPFSNVPIKMPRRLSTGIFLLGALAIIRVFFVYNGQVSSLRPRTVSVRDDCHGSINFNTTYEVVEPLMSNFSTMANFSTNCTTSSGLSLSQPRPAPLILTFHGRLHIFSTSGSTYECDYNCGDSRRDVR
jgi:hypothetical protein